MKKAFMIDVLYKSPTDTVREAAFTDQAVRYGGQLTFREDSPGAGPVCLTYEFPDVTAAQNAAASLRQLGAHIEGPANYGEVVQNRAAR